MTKVLFLFRALPHYANYLLNRLHATPGLGIVSVVPTSLFDYGGGLFHSDDDIEYRLLRLEEVPFRWGGFTFRGLAGVIARERPDIVVVMPEHVRGLVMRPAVLAALTVSRSRLLMRSIPFRLERYETRRAALEHLGYDAVGRRPRMLVDALGRAALVAGLGAGGAARVTTPARGAMLRLKRGKERLGLELERLLYRLPRAHLNYVEEGREVYGSYGVPPERTFVTFNSPDTDRLLAARDQIQREGAPRKNLQRLIHVGRLIAWKRVDLLLRALAGLCVDYPDIEVAVVGSGPQEKEWRELAADLGVAARVSFLGGVYDPVELGRELMRSGIFVLAGMGGLALNDAMCFGLPVVCSVCDGTEKRLVEEGVNGLFFREGDAGDLEAKLRLLLESPDRCEEMGRRSLEKIRNEVNIHTVVERYVEAFEYVLGGAPAKRSILRGVK